MNGRDRLRIKLEAWRDSPTTWLVATIVGLLGALTLLTALGAI